jgi:hypothetical protein
MGKKFQLKTISLGSDPSIPSVDELTSYIKKIRGSDADLITIQMLRSSDFQKQAGLDEYGIGGKYTSPRMNNAISFDEDNEPITDSSEFVDDYSRVIKMGGVFRSVHESPSLLENSPNISDEDEFSEFCQNYKKILRSLRDVGIKGHVIRTMKTDSLELEHISNAKTTIFLQEQDKIQLESLLEFTTKLVILPEYLDLLPDFLDNYKISDLIIVRPEETEINTAIELIDREHIIIAGFAIGEEEDYWKDLKKQANITV